MYDWTKEANAIDSSGLPISAGMGEGPRGRNEKGREVKEHKDGMRLDLPRRAGLGNYGQCHATMGRIHSANAIRLYGRSAAQRRF